MIGLLRVSRWLRRPRTAALTAPAPSVAPEPARETIPPPPWRHGPDKPHERAELCGEPSCDNPVGDHESGEFCSTRCHAAWMTEFCNPVSWHNTDPFHAPDIAPAPPPEPPWMARLTAWERAKPARLVAERKSPGSEGKAA